MKGNTAFGPYIQSSRLDLYRQYAEELIDVSFYQPISRANRFTKTQCIFIQRGHAYRCFCTPERLERLRTAQQARGAATMYDRACLSVTKAEGQKRANANEPHVIRLKTPAGSSSVMDHVYGSLTFPHHVVDDQVLLKSDGFPTYHLASVVDDHLMQISHVIRGAEWLSSLPKHVILYDCFEWQRPKVRCVVGGWWLVAGGWWMVCSTV